MKLTQTARRLCTAILVAILTTVLVIPASAAVITTEAQTSPEADVYVAGTPDMYPLEFYNTETKKYEGIVPLILERVSRDTGLSFCYVSAGETNRQQQLAKNSQVEMITAYIPESGAEEYLSDSVVILEIPVDGETRQVCIAFTSIAAQSLITQVSASIGSITEIELSQMVINYTLGKEAPKDSYIFVWIAGIVLVLALIGVVIRLVVLNGRIKKFESNELIDKNTGIGNKEYFRKYFASYLSDKSRSLYYVAYIGFDIRWVNQHMGVDEAENILKRSADALMNYTRDTDIAARISGGSFALAYQCGNQKDAEAHIQQLLNNLNRQHFDGNVRFSAGIYAIGDGNPSCETAITNAEYAYLRAVRNNKSYMLCNEQMIKDIALEWQIHEQIVDAVSNNEFKPYIQFLVDTKTNQIAGVEMLSRWHNPKEGQLMPGSYIEIMEQSGVIAELDYYMFEHGCRQLQAWANSGKEHLSLSCNFSRVTISQPDFTRRLFSIASKYHFQADRFILEVTEAVMETNKEAALQNVKRCKEHGFSLALDDLGSGYTSFINLCEYPIDLIKIDRSIILNSVLMERGSIMIDAIVAMSHKMGIKVVCEGVEKPEHDEMVRQVGTDYIQGYLYSRVIPLEEADRFISNFGKTE